MVMKFILDGTAGKMMHPARFQILGTLRETKDPMYVDQIAEVTKIHPRMVSHHLDVLEENNLVKSEYTLIKARGSKREVAVRLCSATPKAEEVIKNIRESVR